ncbi:HEPN domain-containing protein [Parabacteroides acidifaciens]|uniref:HEPN domain-containing protein n=1 Tax=Parabacteroides acidifaciens TaxID=2290935 RepID=A0A3D8HJ20_9BACT|nr:HEPN domain-containing protein [Parabacteroides acidifaciens]MBC8600287.1 HEPN domain-containing protein [Parabacteroides acidifaciens]RDU50921.1 HEPN domain-containing protein [Parabacteroides acidifaciens]
MTLSIEEKKAIIEYRIQKAWNSIREAEDNAKLGYWTLAASRLYYAAYYMASALLVDKGIVARSHSGVIHIIGSEFVKKDLLSKEDGRLISRLFNMRQSGDYDDLFDWTEEEVFPFFDKTKTFLNRMEDLISLK